MDDIRFFLSHAKKPELLIGAVFMMILFFVMSYAFAFACVLMGHSVSVCGL